MTSAINTNGINVNYPVPGINNSSQGFRDNFAAIKTDFNITATEITDLQNNVVLKQALTGTTLNNDMANTLISNTLTRGFRASTYNLGNALSGVVIVNTSLGDVQYGTVAGNVTLQFTGWAPAGTQSNVQLQLAVSNSSAIVSFPSEVSLTGSYGVETLENFANVANVPTVSIPYGVSQLDYTLSSIDCGNTITITPYNRPRIDAQIQQRTPSPTGFPGDVAGTVSIDANYIYVCTASYNSIANTVLIANATATGNLLTVSNTGSLTLNDPIIFTGANVTQANLVANTIYYVKAIASSGANGTISVSATRTAGTAGANVPLTTTANGFSSVTYNGTDIWKRISLTTW
jgi:hypothetical protein